jgi:hypothetical protein
VVLKRLLGHLEYDGETLGIESEEARQVAEAAGLTVVMDRCMGETHGEFGLGPGP